MAAKATARAASPLLSLWLDSVESATIAQLEETTAPMASTLTIQEAAFKLVASSFMLGLIHAADEEPGANLADDIIPAIAFEEALKFLSAKIPLTKAEWQKLEPRIRFRSFTIARLGFAHEIEKAKQILIKSLEDGTSYRDTWYDLKKKLEKNESIAPCYWENVYRTNTQSAYVAGKLEQYQNSGVAAYQLMVIEDSRTTAICRNLLSQASGYGAVIPVGDKFWTANGFPPYHYQCRTSIRGVWPSQLKNTKADTAHTAPDLRRFEPMAGFGGNPAQDGLWWQETASQRKQAEAYGVQGMIDRARKALFSEKSEEILANQKLVDPLLLNNVTNRLKEQGITVWMDDEADRFLNHGGAEATIMYPNTVIFHSKLSASGMYEELIHLAQIRKLGREPTTIEITQMEIEAKEKLLRNSKAYGITEYEQEIIRDSIAYYAKLLDESGGRDGRV